LPDGPEREPMRMGRVRPDDLTSRSPIGTPPDVVELDTHLGNAPVSATGQPGLNRVRAEQAVDSQPLLTTKFMPPVARPEAVTRARLHAVLSEGADRRLTLLAAGPGFGKSTLLAAWRQLESARRAVAWLTLSEAENDPATLCMYVAGAVRAVRPDFGSDVEAVLATPAPRVADALRGISNEIA